MKSISYIHEGTGYRVSIVAERHLDMVNTLTRVEDTLVRSFNHILDEEGALEREIQETNERLTEAFSTKTMSYKGITLNMKLAILDDWRDEMTVKMDSHVIAKFIGSPFDRAECYTLSCEKLIHMIGKAFTFNPDNRELQLKMLSSQGCKLKEIVTVDGLYYLMVTMHGDNTPISHIKFNHPIEDKAIDSLKDVVVHQAFLKLFGDR